MLDTRTTTPYAAFLLRVSMGVLFLAHGGLLKLATFGVAGTMGYFGSLGFPPIFGLIVQKEIPFSFSRFSNPCR